MKIMASNEILREARHQQLCREFAAVTGTDTELAMYYLGQKDWKIEEAVNMFYDGEQPPIVDDGNHGDSAGGSMPSTSKSSSQAGGSSDVVLTYQKGAASEYKLGQPPPTELGCPQPPSPGFRLITWNIDGLDPRNRTERTDAVCKILKHYSPDIVFLQEVVPPTYDLICSTMDNYKPLPAAERGYFTVILLKKSTVTYLSSKIETFPESEMDRALQIAECKCAGIDLCVMSSHLESMASKTKERCNQFRKALCRMKIASAEQTVLFGGDTNLRDKEVVQVGVPDYIHDVWVTCGSPPDAKYSWDISKNDNLDWPHPNQPRLRFDRLFMRHAKTNPRVQPQNFRFIGTERLESCHRFPSDHWGIVCEFKVTPLPS